MFAHSKTKPGMGLAFTILSIGSSQLMAQEPLVVQKLQPMKAEAPGASNSSAPIASSGPIQLESMTQASNTPPAIVSNANSSVNVLPLVPARSETKTSKGKLDVNKMIRSPMDHVAVFSKLNIDGSFRVDSPMAANTRSNACGEMGAYDWSPNGYCWQSPAFCHSPLYFEQPNLERYGNKHGDFVTPALSASYFFGEVVTFPARAVWQPPWSKSCTLGNKRPGDCAPFQRHQPIHQESSPTVQVRISE